MNKCIFGRIRNALDEQGRETSKRQLPLKVPDNVTFQSKQKHEYIYLELFSKIYIKMQSIGSPFHSYCPSKKGTQLMTVTVYKLFKVSYMWWNQKYYLRFWGIYRTMAYTIVFSRVFSLRFQHHLTDRITNMINIHIKSSQNTKNGLLKCGVIISLFSILFTPIGAHCLKCGSDESIFRKNNLQRSYKILKKGIKNYYYRQN